MYIDPFPPASNNADWMQSIQVIDDNTGLPVSDLTSYAITLSLRLNSSPVCTLTTANNDIYFPFGDEGSMSWKLPKETMSTLIAGQSYNVGCIAEKDGNTIQLFTGSLPVVEGFVNVL